MTQMGPCVPRCLQAACLCLCQALCWLSGVAWIQITAFQVPWLPSSFPGQASPVGLPDEFWTDTLASMFPSGASGVWGSRGDSVYWLPGFIPSERGCWGVWHMCGTRRDAGVRRDTHGTVQCYPEGPSASALLPAAGLRFAQPK